MIIRKERSWPILTSLKYAVSRSTSRAPLSCTDHRRSALVSEIFATSFDAICVTIGFHSTNAARKCRYSGRSDKTYTEFIAMRLRQPGFYIFPSTTFYCVVHQVVLTKAAITQLPTQYNRPNVRLSERVAYSHLSRLSTENRVHEAVILAEEVKKKSQGAISGKYDARGKALVAFLGKKLRAKKERRLLKFGKLI